MTEEERKQHNREAQHRWYLKHKEQKKAQVSRWRAENPDKVDHYNNVWLLDHGGLAKKAESDKRTSKKRWKKYAKAHPNTAKKWYDRDTTIDD